MNDRRILLGIGLMVLSLFSARAFAQKTLTLDDCLRIASANAPSLQQAKQNYQSAWLTAEAQSRSLLSTVDLTLQAPLYTDNATPVLNTTTGTYDLLKQRNLQLGGTLSIYQPIYWTGGAISLSGTLYNQQQGFQGTTQTDYVGIGSISLSQPLFKANELKLADREAQIALTLSRANYRTQWASLNYRIKSLFFGLYQAERELQIQKDEVASSDSAYQLASNKFKAGLIAEVDALQLEVDLSAARTDLFDKERILLSAKRNLLAALGMPMHEEVSAKVDSLEDVKTDVDGNLAVARALANREDVLNAQYGIEREDIAIDRLDGQRSINASLTGSFGGSNSMPKIADLTQNPNINRGVTLSINVPIFDWGAHSLRMDAAHATLESDKISLKLVQDQVEEEVLSAIEQLKAAHNQADVAEKSVVVAQKAYDLSKLRFATGKITSQDLSLAQQRLTKARFSALSAKVAEHLGLGDLTQKTLYDYASGTAIELPADSR